MKDRFNFSFPYTDNKLSRGIHELAWKNNKDVYNLSQQLDKLSANLLLDVRTTNGGILLANNLLKNVSKGDKLGKDIFNQLKPYTILDYLTVYNYSSTHTGVLWDYTEDEESLAVLYHLHTKDDNTYEVAFTLLYKDEVFRYRNYITVMKLILDIDKIKQEEKCLKLL